MTTADGAAQDARTVLSDLLAGYRPRTPTETGDVTRIQVLLTDHDDPWSRQLDLHVTASALIVHPDSGQVLLRWHARQGGWLHVGGHGDPGEVQPLEVAIREAVEETGLDDVRPWPDADLLHVAVVPVPASAREGAHEHADLRFVLATGQPDQARPENQTAALRWADLPDARQAVTSPSLHETLDRLADLLPTR
jgi:8-oxo-dGTP pyrophosphatase MutT (NUDIX family)